MDNPGLLAADLLAAQLGTVRGRAMRDAVKHAHEIVQLAGEWERRAAAGAEPVATDEISDTIARHVREMEYISSALRGTVAIYRALRDAMCEMVLEAQRQEKEAHCEE